MHLLSIFYVPGTVLGPGNPLMKEADKDPWRQEAQILETRTCRPVSISVSVGPLLPPSAGLELGGWGWAVGCWDSSVSSFQHWAQRHRDARGAPGSGPALPLTILGKAERHFPSCTTERAVGGLMIPRPCALSYLLLHL